MAEGTRRDYELKVDPSWSAYRLRYGDSGPANPTGGSVADDRAEQDGRERKMNRKQVGDTSIFSRIGRGARDNIIPLALIAAGVAVLFARRPYSDRAGAEPQYDPYDYSPYQGHRRRLTAASTYQDDLDDPAYRQPYTRADFESTNASGS